MSVTLTEVAAQEVKKVMEEQGMSTDTDVLRVSINGGGCAGFSYGLTFNKKEEINSLNDSVYQGHGISWVVDNKSALYLEGTEIDFVSDISKRGFAFNNPNSKGSCGCGMSFQCK